MAFQGGKDWSRGQRNGGRGTKGGGRGKGKDGKKGPAMPAPAPGRSQKWDAGETNTTPDGRLKCFRYQRGKCSDPRCDKVHVCLVCNGEHPKKACPRRPKFGDAAGRPSSFQ